MASQCFCKCLLQMGSFQSRPHLGSLIVMRQSTVTTVCRRMKRCLGRHRCIHWEPCALITAPLRQETTYSFSPSSIRSRSDVLCQPNERGSLCRVVLLELIYSLSDQVLCYLLRLVHAQQGGVSRLVACQILACCLALQICNLATLPSPVIKEHIIIRLMKVFAKYIMRNAAFAA